MWRRGAYFVGLDIWTGKRAAKHHFETFDSDWAAFYLIRNLGWAHYWQMGGKSEFLACKHLEFVLL